MAKSSKKDQGFTLIELIMVIVILAILAAAAIPTFSDLSADAANSRDNYTQAANNRAAAITNACQGHGLGAC